MAALALQPFTWGAGGEKLTPDQLDRRRKVADALRQREGYVPAGWMSLLGGLAGEGVASYKESEIDKQESEAQKRVADALMQARGGSDPNAYLDVMGDPFATPQQSAIASALYQQAQPDYQTMSGQGGDVLRWNQNDPNAQPEVWYDAPDQPAPPPEPPKTTTIFDPTTGRDKVVQWNPDIGDWEDLGGIQAPKDPLVTVNTGDGADADFYKAGAKARGETFAGIEADGIAAQTNIGQLNRLEQLLTTAPTGAEGMWKQFAGEFGIATDGLNDIQGAQALINKMVPDQRPPGSGTMSDADLALFKASLPRIVNQPGGNALILQTLKGIAVYDQTMGDIATRALNHEISPAQARSEMKTVPNPLELFRSAGGSASDAGNAPAGVDPEVWAEMTPEERALWD